MRVPLVALSLILSAGLTASAVLKLTGRPAVVDQYVRVGVPPAVLPRLAMLLLLGSAGLVVGLWWRPLGIGAAAALLVYFALAVAAHVRHRALDTVVTPVLLGAAAAATLVLHSIR